MALARQILADLQSLSSASAQQLFTAAHKAFALTKSLTKYSQRLFSEQLQQLMRQMSHLLYQRQQTPQTQLYVLALAKQILISGDYAAYLFSNVYIFPWIVTICTFQQEQSLQGRAKLLCKENTGSNPISTTVFDAYKRLLDYAQEFLVFFGDKLKFYPYSKYKIKSSLARQLQNGNYKRSLGYFTSEDQAFLQGNLKKKSASFRDDLSKFTDFINTKIQECMESSSKFHDNLFLLLSLVETSDSYCISSTAFRLSSFFHPEKVVLACQMADYILSTAEIQAAQCINIRCLPIMLEYLLPVNFKEQTLRERPKANLQAEVLNKFIDYFYLWLQKTKLLKLSIKIYELCYPMIQYLKKPFKFSFQPQIKEFKNHLEKMEQSNELKRAFIIDQHQQQEQAILNLLKEAVFCVSSQRVQRQIAYENVLDDLTITERESMSDFSQSLLQSAKIREDGHQSINSERENNRSLRKLKSSKAVSKQSQLQSRSIDSDSKEQIENIYYTNKNHLARPSANNNQLQSFQNHPRQKHGNNQHESQAHVQYPSFPKVSSNYRGKARQTPEISFHSSQFSHKDNNDRNRPTESVYLNRSKDKSGEFLYFEKQSELKSVEQLQISRQQNELREEIEFNDSLKMANQSQSEELQEFGMDINAKIPQTIAKPKFNFKNAETGDSSILKGQFTPANSSVQSIRLATGSKPHPKFDESPILAYQISKSEEQSNLGSIVSQISPIIKTSPTPSQHSRISSSSIINDNSLQPHLISESLSLSKHKPPSKFGEVFRQKSEKASVLSSSRSLRNLRRLPERQVQVPDLKKLRDLENQLGLLKKETEQYSKQLGQKKQEMQRLQKQKMEIAQSDPYYLKKQNEIMKILLQNRTKSPEGLPSSSARLSKELKQSSIKNYNMSLKDYNPSITKLKFSNIKAFSKQQRKNIISSRCVLLKNQLIQIGYSFKHSSVGLYLTLKNYCESLEINLIDNSLIFSQCIRRSFDKLYVGKQMKFKTQVASTKSTGRFVPSSLLVRLTYHFKLQLKTQQFSCDLPLTPYNIAQPLQSPSSLSQTDGTAYITPLYNSSEELLKKGKQYLLAIFPHGHFNQDETVFTVNYKYKERVEVISLKLKERAFRVEGIGFPMDSGRELIETVIGLLIDSV